MKIDRIILKECEDMTSDVLIVCNRNVELNPGQYLPPGL